MGLAAGVSRWARARTVSWRAIPVMKLLTKVTYLVILLALSLIPLVVWARNPAEVDLAGVGAFAGGLGVPMGTLTAAMAAKSIQRGKDQREKDP